MAGQNPLISLLPRLQVHFILELMVILSSYFKENKAVDLVHVKSNGFLELNLEESRFSHEVDKRFLSVAVDSLDLYRHWKRVNLK